MVKTFKQFVTEEEQAFSPNHVSIYPHGQGSDVGKSIPQPKPTMIKTGSALGNEPFKDKDFFTRPDKKDYMSKMTSDIKAGKQMPPTLSTPHPADPSNHVIVDGNHRFAAHQMAGAPKMRTQSLSHDDIHIMPNDYGKKNTGVPLSSFREKDGSYDMAKKRDELGGKTLNHYFVKPDGSHQFKSPFEKSEG